jgi:hypothetical protein
MDTIMAWLSTNVPEYVWQILLFLAPSNPLLRFIFGKFGYIPREP